VICVSKLRVEKQMTLSTFSTPCPEVNDAELYVDGAYLASWENGET